MQTFIKKYQPANCKGVEGQDVGVGELKDFVVNFKRQKKKAALICGPSGVGKTCSVYAVANDIGYEVIEVNASDFRNKEQINSIVGNAIAQQSLFAKGKIILVDEIDGLSGTKDRGGLKALTSLISDSRFPIVMTVMNPYDFRLNALRSKSNLIKFEPLSNDSVYRILRKICECEKISFDEKTLKSMARRSGGDLRGCINDLQAVAENGEIKSLELSDRKKVETMISALLRVFKTTDVDIARTAFDDVEEDIDEQFLWIDENLPKEYSSEDLARAYDRLSKADVYRGRIRRWQHWRFLNYISILMTAGIATSKKQKNQKSVGYKPTTRLLKIWQAKQKNMKKRVIAAKFAGKTHCSTKRALENLPFIQSVFKKNYRMAEGIAMEIGLEKEEIEWLKK